MHPVKKQLNDLIEYFTHCAEMAQFRRHIDQRMFLFGIEIGRRRPLTSYERQAYLKTFWTALTLLVVDETYQKSRGDEDALKKAFAEATDNWLQNSRVIARWIEAEQKHHGLPVPSKQWKMDSETRRLLVSHLERISAEWPEALPYHEIQSLLDRLEHPLDRA
jgi:hypothetical protein